MGIGLHGGGVGVIKFLVEQGAKVLATDLRSKTELADSLKQLKDLSASPNQGKHIEYVLGRHRLEDFTDTELVIKNPGVPDNSEFLAAARAKGIPIESDIGIFLELCPAPIIGVSGTKGKSTTATLIANIFSQHFPQVILAGNIRQSALTKLSEITKDTIVVLELSSWQLADAKEHKKSPYVAIITNILEDHLNRYNTFQDYVEDKKLIHKFQKDKDYLFLNFADQLSRELSKEVKSRIYFYSTDGSTLLKEELPKINQKARLGAYAKSQKIYYGAAQEEICDVKDVKLIGQHNLANVLAAVSVADLYNVPREKIKKALREFKGLAGRLQLIAEKDGVKFINDTTATAPDAAIAAIHAVSAHYFPDRVKKGQTKEKHLVLIAGGADKDLDFTKLGETIADHIKAVVLLEGTATPKLTQAITKPEIIKGTTDNMIKAVKLARSSASDGDIILLSPGCASFGLFKHEFDRGQKFNEAINSL